MESLLSKSNLEFRCPHCQKLYTTDVKEVVDSISYFECYGCDSLFALEKVNVGVDENRFSTFLVPANKDKVVNSDAGSAAAQFTFSQQDAVEKSRHNKTSPEKYPETQPVIPTEAPSETFPTFHLRPELDFKVEASSTLKTCPKCGSLAAKAARECYSCGIIFERYQLAHSEGDWAVHPSLVRRWRELVIDFDNSQIHEDFIQSCFHLNSLPFAKKKYVEIKTLQGHDADCDRFIKRIEGLMRTPNLKKEFIIDKKPVAQVSTIETVLTAFPFVMSFALIVAGMSGAHYRNLIGLGVSLAVLSYGVVQYIRRKRA